MSYLGRLGTCLLLLLCSLLLSLLLGALGAEILLGAGSCFRSRRGQIEGLVSHGNMLIHADVDRAGANPLALLGDRLVVPQVWDVARLA